MSRVLKYATIIVLLLISPFMSVGVWLMYWGAPIWVHAAAAAKSCQLCPTLCDPIDGSSPGSPVPGILQARTLEWVAISFSNEWKWKVKGKSLSHVWLSDPMDCSLPASSVHGIFQARVLEWGAIAFSESTYNKYELQNQPQSILNHRVLKNKIMLNSMNSKSGVSLEHI